MKIIVDAMGGDFAPRSTVEGALLAQKEYGVEVILVGQSDKIRQALADCGETVLPAGIEIRHASQVIEIADDPATAFKQKKDSSVTVGMNMLHEGQGDAFVSAGSTGALLSAATLLVKRVRGIRRAAMAPVIPTAGGKAVLIDCGANAECTPEYLLQFAFMGSYYVSSALKIPDPRIGLLNIGAEPTKGDELRRETYRRLKEAGEAGQINFIGNIEAKEAMLGGADVIVADGFSGNVMLKCIEGVGSFMGKTVKNMFLSDMTGKIAGLLMRKKLRTFKSMLDPNRVGGTPFLGISAPVIKAHGSSNAEAIKNAIHQAEEFARSGMIADIEEHIDLMRLPPKGEGSAERASGK